MNVLTIPLSKPAIERFRQLPKPEQTLLKNKVAALLEQALANSTVENMAVFQEAMQMSNDDMLLTFGADYLSARNWVPTHD